MLNEDKLKRSNITRSWIRIPDGTKVRCSAQGIEGTVDGLTEIVTGSNLNPDGKTQYRIDVGAPRRELAVETDLLILTDHDGLVLMAKERKATVDYRRHVTEQLHGVFTQNRFISPAPPETNGRAGVADHVPK